MKIRKSLNYAYPTSTHAKQLDCSATGCYYVGISVLRENMEWSVTEPAHNAEGFLTLGDPDLQAIFAETDGDRCPFSL